MTVWLKRKRESGAPAGDSYHRLAVDLFCSAPGHRLDCQLYVARSGWRCSDALYHRALSADTRHLLDNSLAFDWLGCGFQQSFVSSLAIRLPFLSARVETDSFNR